MNDHELHTIREQAKAPGRRRRRRRYEERAYKVALEGVTTSPKSLYEERANNVALEGATTSVTSFPKHFCLLVEG